jgi:mono/diheme cytochrome c family protein
MDRLGALALLEVSARMPPDRHASGSAAKDGAVHALPIAALAASAQAQAIVFGILVVLLGSGIGGAGRTGTGIAAEPLYRVVNGKVDARTYEGYRRYHAGCNHCHGPDGVGSSFGPSLVAAPFDIAAFRDAVRNGRASGTSVMKGFAGDANVEPFIDDIHAYLTARAEGVLGRGRPARLY